MVVLKHPAMFGADEQTFPPVFLQQYEHQYFWLLFFFAWLLEVVFSFYQSL
jgi:hypothetical protein